MQSQGPSPPQYGPPPGYPPAQHPAPLPPKKPDNTGAALAAVGLGLAALMGLCGLCAVGNVQKQEGGRAAGAPVTRPEIEADWQALAADRQACAAVSYRKACDPVVAHLARWPDSPHRAEVESLFRAAEARLAALEEANDWLATQPHLATCMAPKRSDDCKPVRAYLDRWPYGAHVNEASAAIRHSYDKIQQLARQEQPPSRPTAGPAGTTPPPSGGGGVDCGGRVRCCDGTCSPSCTFVKKGCCSKHGGVCG